MEVCLSGQNEHGTLSETQVRNVACISLGRRGRRGNQGRGCQSRHGASPKRSRPRMEQNCDMIAVRTSSQKVRVGGVHRVWVSLKETTVSSLKSTIMIFSPSASLVVKRKTTRNDNGEIKRWWYVLHDSEEAFQVL